MSNGWEKLLCAYFESVCLRVLGDYFDNKSFTPRKTKVGGVLFQGRGVFIEVSYIPETAPRYAPTLIVGIGSEKYDNNGKPTGVPLWYVIPDNCPEQKYSLWKFSSESELVSILEKIRAEILEQYVRPLWENMQTLREQVKKFVVNQNIS